VEVTKKLKDLFQHIILRGTNPSSVPFEFQEGKGTEESKNQHFAFDCDSRRFIEQVVDYERVARRKRWK
jgi:hypothetical protein